MSRTEAPVSFARLHHSFKPETFRDFVIHVQLGRLDSQLVAGQTRQPFNVELRLIADVGNIFCPKNKYIAAMRFDEVITKFVHEDLVASVDRAAGDDFAGSVTDSR